MIRELSGYILAFAALPLLAGCADTVDTPDGPDVPGGAGMVTVTLRNSEPTRSVESDNSETLIKNAVVALYPEVYGEETPAVAIQTFENIEKNTSATVQMRLSDDMVQTLFGGASGKRCKLYALANVDLSKVPANATIAQLKALEVGSAFHTSKLQESFSMAGEGTVTYTSDGKSGRASGSGNLVRTAAKISLNLKFPDSVEIKDENGNVKERWYPVTTEGNGTRVFLINGVKNSTVVAPEKPANAEDYFTMNLSQSDVVRVITNIGDGSEYPYKLAVPLYTYPNAWEETPEEKHRTSMTLVVPWKKDGENSFSTFYYQVPVTDLTKIVSNHAYTVNLNVGMLGSLSPETPEELTDLSYQIVDWGKADVNVDIKDTRYLVVSPNQFSFNNEENMVIPFFTSHPAEITDIKMEYDRFNFYSNGNGDVVTFTVEKDTIDRSNTATDKFCTYTSNEKDVNGNNVIKLYHPLKVWDAYTQTGTTPISMTGNSSNTTLSSLKIYSYKPSNPLEDAYSPYTITLTIRHTDKPEFYEVVKIKQYPAMYIEAKRNPGGRYRTSNRGWEQDWGNVFVNAVYHAASGRDYAYWENSTTLGGVTGVSGSNTNPNMYVVNVSILNQFSNIEYVVGDPRSEKINVNLSTNGRLNTDIADAKNNIWTVDAKSLYDNASNRKLKYYYPTVESTEKNYAYMLAPKIRVASSYGKTSHMDITNCRRRVAAYQEQGYPAGRWRLPTLGEFTFITQLSAEGKIPILFSQNVYYLTAQGGYKVNVVNNKAVVTGSSQTTDLAVRGVYDEWYWEQYPQYELQQNASGGYDFTWGDVPRNATRSASLINMYKSKMKR